MRSKVSLLAENVLGAMLAGAGIGIAIFAILALLGLFGGCVNRNAGERYPIDYPLVDPVTTQTWDHIVDEAHK